MPFEERLKNLHPPNAKTFLPWLLMAAAPAADLAHGKVALPWLGAAGLAAFAGLYMATLLTAFRPVGGRGPLPRRLLLALVLVTYALGAGYGGDWMLCFPLASLCVGAVLRERDIGAITIALAVSAGAISVDHGSGFWDGVTIGYGTVLSGLVTAAILSLFEAVRRLRETRQALAETAVAQERLRFSRDLHDLLGHTLSVVVVKAEAVRRLGPRDLDAALGQAADIESVGRQALAEIRQAVTGYREGSLANELTGARSALRAVGIEPVVHESGPPLPPQAEGVLGWVVREGVTNVVRHSRAARCEIEVRGDGEQVRLRITDDGGPAEKKCADAAGSGSGLRGLSERLAAVGGRLTAGPTEEGFRVEAVLQVGGTD